MAARFEALADELRELLGGYDVGSPFLSQGDVVTRFGVARMTAGRALHVLVDEGLLEVHQGIAPRVARKPGGRPPVTLESLAAQLDRIEAKLDEALRDR